MKVYKVEAEQVYTTIFKDTFLTKELAETCVSNLKREWKGRMDDVHINIWPIEVKEK
jgi:hypothetical protein